MPKQQIQKEPIAIIGIGCRLPGGSNSANAYWKMMCAGTDTIGEIPGDRWNVHSYYDPVPGKPGKSISKWGGFIEGIDKFDPGFFGISPREADWMDPQQRLLLETCWEALEDGGQVLEKLRRSPTGVFVGISTTDYSLLQSSPGERVLTDVYTATGGTISIAANRISYCFDFNGPSISMDTACSSALTAVHVACQSLWKGECAVALAAGVNAILGPGPYIAFSRMSMLSPDGRCKAFDSHANGFVRGEGAGAIALKPLSAALADGDPIYAVIRSTAANQDGRTNGLTVPSPMAQEALVRQACRDAGVKPADIKYVEAHGTGTPVGDPIEAHALGSALGEGRPEDEPCIMGSVKTNIGHLEAAAGIAGIIKTALVLKHGLIPPNLHFANPNPHIDFTKLKLRVIQKMESFPNGSGAMLAGINSFGFGGSNAHAILEAAPASNPKKRSAPKKSSRQSLLLPISARSPEALKAVVKNYQTLFTEAARANGSGPTLKSICADSALRRTHHSYRLCVVADTREEMTGKLDAFLAGESRPGLMSGQTSTEGDAQPVFIFSGQGPQWWAMGRELLKEEPIFRARIEECDRLFHEFGGWSLLKELRRDEADSRLEQTALAQPAIFSLQVALAALWESWGIRPAAVVGHSVGEVAAAHVAGILTLRDAAHVIFQRGRCMELADGRGRMLAVSLEPGEARKLISQHPGQLAIAAFNGPASLTLSGDSQPLEEITHALEERGVFCRFLQVNYAFHSHQMDPVRKELIRALGEIKLSPATLPIFSTVTGRQTDGLDLTAEYWWRNVREPVRFSDAIDALVQQGRRIFVELSAHPALLVSISECLASRSARGTVLPSLRRKEKERATMLESLGGLHLAGFPVDWQALYPAESSHVHLPSYPWQRERYWQEPALNREIRLDKTVHPFLTRNLKASDPGWVTWLDQDVMPYLRDHRVQGHIVFPGAGYLETAIGVGRKLFGSVPIRIEEMDFQKALFLPENKDVVQLQCSYNPTDLSVKFSSRTEQAGEAWTLNAIGKLQGMPQEQPPAPVDLEAIRNRCSAHQIPGEHIYAGYDSVGLCYGPLFRGVETIWRRDGEALGLVRLPEALLEEAPNYNIHPSLMDACFHVHTLAIPAKNPLGMKMLLPVFLERLRFFGKPGPVVWCHATVANMGSRFAVWNFQILDEAGHLLVDLQGFRSQAMSGTRQSRLDRPEDWLYENQWKLKPLTATAPVESPQDFLATNAEIAREVERDVEIRLRGTDILSRTKKFESGLNRLAGLFVIAALQRLGCRWKTGQKITLKSAAKALAIKPERHGILKHLLSFLATNGILQVIDTGWKVRRAPALVDPAISWRNLLSEFPGAHPELTLLLRCGEGLGGILSGKLEAAKLISPDGSMTLLEHFYQDSITHQASNNAVAGTIAAALRRQPIDRVVRILEIAGGTGGRTAYVLPKLRANRTDYVFSDSEESSLTKAEQKFFDYSFVRYQKLDLTINPAEQGFKPGAFDLILLSDFRTGTTDASLKHVRALLAPGGLLVTLQQTRPPRWSEFVFGLKENWQNNPAAESEHTTSIQSLATAGFEQIDAFALPRIPGASRVLLARAQTGSLQSTSSPTAKVQSDADSRSWLILADASGVGERLATLLKERGDIPLLVFPGENYQHVDANHFQISVSSAPDMSRLLADSAAGLRPLAGAIHLWSLDAAAPADLNSSSLAEAEKLTSHSSLHLVQALSQSGALKSPQLWLVTRGSQSVHPGEEVSCAQAPAWGVGRAVLTEYRHIRCRLVDLTPGGGVDDARALFSEITSDEPETEVAFRGSARHVNRLTRTSLEQHAPVPKPSVNRSYRLEITSPGIIDQLTFRGIHRRKPSPGEVEIEICAAALNFRDVMKALGIYPSENDIDLLLGDECAGRIVSVGKKVRGFKVGDEVIANGPGCFSSHLTIPAACVVPKPSRISYEEAVTIPVTFMTAWYALHSLGHIRKGEKVLVQAATGGVGLAAMQIAQLARAEIFATAGNPEKRDFLRAMGVQHIMDSRSVSFADEIRRITGGRGVDLVLNSLAGQAISKGLSVLAPHGRFLEIGKRDIYQNTAIGLRPFRNNLSMFVIDMGQVMLEQPEFIQSLLKPIMAQFQTGKLRPLPHRVLPISRAVSAFRLMAQARHIGKIVVSMQNDPVTPAPIPKKQPIRFAAKASYLITGGLGGFGLAIAKWLVERGARHLVLTGRSGAATPEARRAIKDLKHLGAKILVVKADISNARDVQRIFNLTAMQFPPVRGIMHAAMVLDDGILAQLTPERFSRVMGPKVTGAWNLHTATARMPLDFFVLFSSVSSLVGAAGQGNYVAANSFLDAFAHYRRSRGLPALSVNWGALSEVGIVARHSKVEEHLASHGVLGLKPAQATDMLGRLLQSEASQIGFMRIDWQKFASASSGSFNTPRFSELVQFSNQEQADTGGELRQTILAAPASERLALVAAHIREPVAKVLRTSADKLDTGRPLKELGLDSLMAFELLNRIESRFGISLPPSKLSAGGTINSIAAVVLEILAGTSTTAFEHRSHPVVPAPQSAPDADQSIADCILPLRAEGARTPLFCLHPAGGFVSIYKNLVAGLPADLPVYGIQSRILFGEPERSSVQLMARDYAQLIMKQQPSGHIRLAGFSMGGFFALATAAELVRQDREIGLVGLIDTPLSMLDPDCPREVVLRELMVEMYDYFAGEISFLKRMDPDELSTSIGQLVKKSLAATDEARSEIIMNWLTASGLILPDRSNSIIEQFIFIASHHTNLVKGLNLDSIPAPIRLWTAGRAEAKVADSKISGEQLTTAGFFRETLDGRHFELMHPPLVGTLAARMDAALDGSAREEQLSPGELVAE